MLGTVPAVHDDTGSPHAGRRMELIMARIPVRLLFPALAFALVATAASAQTVHSVQIGVGGVFPRGLDGAPPATSSCATISASRCRAIRR